MSLLPENGVESSDAMSYPTLCPIVILAPMGPVGFIYDVADTDGRRLPAYFDGPFQVEGCLEKAIWDNTLNNCIEKEKFRIVFCEKSFLNGACVSKNRGGQYIIEINKNFESVELWYSSLVHELAHIYCGHLGDEEAFLMWSNSCKNNRILWSFCVKKDRTNVEKILRQDCQEGSGGSC